jgi:hypothetical protein
MDGDLGPVGVAAAIGAAGDDAFTARLLNLSNRSPELLKNWRSCSSFDLLAYPDGRLDLSRMLPA